MKWPVLILAALVVSAPAMAQEQMGDMSFRPVVVRPAYAAEGPLIRLDAAHGSVQTIDGRYAGFAALMRADGYRIEAGDRKLDAPGALAGADVLVISNAVSPQGAPGASAFTDSEIAALDAWVRAGGSLLLAVDHAPYGTANAALGRALGVDMGKGYAFRFVEGRITTQMMFTAAEGTLGDHAILRGRDGLEAVSVVRSFTGQSLSGPPGATVLMALKPDDLEAADTRVLQQINYRIEGDPSGRESVLAELSRSALPAQGLAFEHGQGRVVVLGEAGMLTAQRVRFPEEMGREDLVFGLQTPGHDDQQFALNILHWLSGLLT